ncbi:MAG TPA: DUF5662 family protein [Candidatus Saccharimonadales bacterium]|jgi:hypothetical protein|nr:DUF5662 family protein [Candidatus Saccharimonadales bacterium]
MKAHLRYLRYVLLHKLYVFRAGIIINGWSPLWVWRLLIHDLSKFLPSEWSPYVAKFYRPMPTDPVLANADLRAFNAAWLKHQHRNSHHWQHWVLREDTGATLILIPPVADVDEMVADWIGAGTKILSWPTMACCIAETVGWYCANLPKIQMRDATKQRVEQILVALCRGYGLTEAALRLHDETLMRQRITIAAPQHGGLARIEQR